MVRDHRLRVGPRKVTNLISEAPKELHYSISVGES